MLVGRTPRSRSRARGSRQSKRLCRGALAWDWVTHGGPIVRGIGPHRLNEIGDLWEREVTVVAGRQVCDCLFLVVLDPNRDRDALREVPSRCKVVVQRIVRVDHIEVVVESDLKWTTMPRPTLDVAQDPKTAVASIQQQGIGALLVSARAQGCEPEIPTRKQRLHVGIGEFDSVCGHLDNLAKLAARSARSIRWASIHRQAVL